MQPEALGTANAVLAAEAWTAGAPFLVMNADNLYPAAGAPRSASLAEPGLPVFERDELVRTSNIPAERVLAFALVDVDDEGYLTAIIEKPGVGFRLMAEATTRTIGRRKDVEVVRLRRRRFVSMNCWRFDARIFEACREVPRSARGEFELPEAVAARVARGVRFRRPRRGPVLDLSRRADTADVERRLAGVEPRL